MLMHVVAKLEKKCFLRITPNFFDGSNSDIRLKCLLELLEAARPICVILDDLNGLLDKREPSDMQKGIACVSFMNEARKIDGLVLVVITNSSSDLDCVSNI